MSCECSKSQEDLKRENHIIFLETDCEVCGKWDHGKSVCDSCEYDVAGYEEKV